MFLHLRLKKKESDRLYKIVDKISRVPWHQTHTTLATKDAELLISVISKANESIRIRQEALFEAAKHAIELGED